MSINAHTISYHEDTSGVARLHQDIYKDQSPIMSVMNNMIQFSLASLVTTQYFTWRIGRYFVTLLPIIQIYQHPFVYTRNRGSNRSTYVGSKDDQELCKWRANNQMSLKPLVRNLPNERTVPRNPCARLHLYAFRRISGNRGQRGPCGLAELRVSRTCLTMKGPSRKDQLIESKLMYALCLLF